MTLFSDNENDVFDTQYNDELECLLLGGLSLHIAITAPLKLAEMYPEI